VRRGEERKGKERGRGEKKRETEMIKKGKGKNIRKRIGGEALASLEAQDKEPDLHKKPLEEPEEEEEDVEMKEVGEGKAGQEGGEEMEEGLDLSLIERKRKDKIEEGVKKKKLSSFSSSSSSSSSAPSISKVKGKAKKHTKASLLSFEDEQPEKVSFFLPFLPSHLSFAPFPFSFINYLPSIFFFFFFFFFFFQGRRGVRGQEIRS